MKNIKRFSFVLTILSVVLGVLSVTAPAANADGDGDFHFTVVSAAYDYAEAEFSIDNETRLTVNGATQLTWWAPDHNVKASPKAIKKAPYIKVKYTKCAKQSKSIAKQAGGASIVVAKVGSVICNTGKNGNIVGGFKWKVSKGPAVLKWNPRLKLYEHLFNLIVPKNLRAGDEVVGYMKFRGKRVAIVKLCRNRMGGHVDVMYPGVVQIRYEQDVQKSGVAKAKTRVYTDVEFGVTCPNGAYFKVKAGASAYGYAQAGITFTERTRATVLGAKKASLTSESHADGRVSAVSAAQLSLDVSGNCGSNPPPPQPTMTLSLDKPNDLDQSVATPGEPIDWSFTQTYGHAVAPTGEGDVTYKVSAEYGFVKFITANSPCETNGLRDNVVTTITKPSGTYDLALCYIASTENPASYGGSDTITLSAVFAGKTYTDSKSITVNPTPTIPW